MSSPPAKPMINALTVDLEDWIQSVYDHDQPLTDCFRRNTERVLEILDARGVRATFFVLGLAARKAPDLIRRLHAEGHEIQSHGYGHRPVHSQAPTEFKEDLLRSKRALEDLIGVEVFTYRAPMFSIGPATPWAIDVLAESGFRCDSSLFPVRMRRYGVSVIPRGPFRLTTTAGHQLLETPVASWQIGPVRIPAGGGGYLRLLPFGVFRRAIRQLNGQGVPATIYVHPYEFAPDEFNRLPLQVPSLLRWRQGAGRRRFAGRVERLLSEFHFGPLASAVPETAGTQAPRWPMGLTTDAGAGEGVHSRPDDATTRTACLA